MYRANEDEFDGKNMNRLRTGKILRIPEGDDLNTVAQADAVKEIHAQAADWHAYRLKLAAASNSVAEQAPKQEASGKIRATVDDKAPPAKESAREVVRLSKGEAPGDTATAGGNAKAVQDKLHALEEEAIAKSKALKDSNERIAMLEKNIKEMQRLLELKGQPVPSTPALSKVEEPVPVDVKPANKLEPPKIEVKPLDDVPSAVAPASAVKPVKSVAPKVITPPPSLLDEILGEPLYLAGGAVALLGLGGLGFMLARRREGGKKKEESGSANTYIAAPIASSPDTGDFTNIATASDAVVSAESDDVDPISEADLFLNFGRDKQAEEILKDALKKDPDNQQIRLKLLSIYADRKDTKTFSGFAGEVRDSGDAAAWAQAAEMGHKLEPGNPMYGGDGATEAAAVSQDETTAVQPAASLDFDLGFDEPEAGAAESTPPALDVPLEVVAATPSGLDLDIGFDATAEAAPTIAEHENAIMPDEPQVEKAEAPSVIDFDLGFEVPTEAEAIVPVKPDFERNMVPDEDAKAPENLQTAQEIPLEFEIPPEPPALKETAAVKAEVPAEAEEAMEFTLDFPGAEESAADDKEAPVSAPAVSDEEDSLGLSEINLNLDAPVSAPAEEVKDAHWHDVATKLDLARAYQEMGDASGAREILEEVLKEGDAQQRAAAEVMMQQLSA
jgi:pilus assembly protein FimV